MLNSCLGREHCVPEFSEKNFCELFRKCPHLDKAECQSCISINVNECNPTTAATTAATTTTTSTTPLSTVPSSTATTNANEMADTASAGIEPECYKTQDFFEIYIAHLNLDQFWAA